MRSTTLCGTVAALVILLAALLPQPALAGGGKRLYAVSDDVRVRKTPSRTAATVVEVAADEPVEIIKKKGKWAKVRVRGTVGWVLVADLARKPRKKAAPAPAARAAAPDEGRKDGVGPGWNAGMMGGDDAASPAAAAPQVADDDEPDDALPVALGQARMPAPFGLSFGAGLGVSQIIGRMDSNGTSPLAHYGYGIDAFTAGAFARASARLGRHVLYGADLGFVELRSYPGIRYLAADGSMDHIGVGVRSFAAGGFAGWQSGGLRVVARAGYDFAFLDVGDLDNLAALPREHRHAVTAGAWLEQDDFWDLCTLRVSADAQVLGVLAQTPGREDGERAETQGARAGLAAVWRSGPLELTVDYRFAWATASFAGASQRMPGATSGERSERQHSLMFVVAVGR